MKTIKKRTRILSTLLCMVLLNSVTVSAHSMDSWSKKYTRNNAGGEYQFAFSKNTLHINGNTVTYYWENPSVKNKLLNALNNAITAWDGLINAKEVPAEQALVEIKYDPDNTNQDIAAYALRQGGNNGHLSTNSIKSEITFTKAYNYEEQDKIMVMAHELGHLWSIDDLYYNNKNLDSIYSNSYRFTKATRHDKNAMRIALDNPWFENADGTMKYQKSPGVWANNEWLTIKGTEYYFKGQTKYTAYKVKYNANGGNGAPNFQTKLFNENLTLSNQTPTKNFTIKYNANGGTVSQTSKNISATFKSWNSNINGTGTAYSPGAIYNENSAKNLYAQWNNPTAGNFPTVNRPHYIFKGWYDAAKGGNKVSSSTPVTSNVTYYAQWISSNSINKNASYSAIIKNAGEHKYFRFTPPADGVYQFTSTGDLDTYVTLFTDNKLNYELAHNDDGGSDKNFSLVYWLKAGKTYYFDTKLYLSGKTGTYSVKITDYNGATTYNIDYIGNADDSTNIPSKDKKVSTTNYTLEKEEPIRPNYTFLGWDTNKSAKDPAYYTSNGKYNKSYSTNQNVTFYAIWGLRGDINRDNTITLVDAQLALKIATGSMKPTIFQEKLMDYNKDGQINMTDVQLIQKKALGIN